jgi:hypothetical protein
MILLTLIQKQGSEGLQMEASQGKKVTETPSQSIHQAWLMYLWSQV